MTTLAQVVKKIVADSIDHEYLDGESLRSVYLSEYGYNGVTPKACTDYLQGLPSVCTIPFNNFEVLELLSSNGITRKSEAAQGKLIDEYWKVAGRVFWLMVKV